MSVGTGGLRGRLATWYTFTRPFTLLPPAIGMISGGVTGWYAEGEALGPAWRVVANLILGAFMAAFLNAASNAINQVYDLDVDRINKPDRMIPSGRMSVREAHWVAWVLYAISLALALAINMQCFIIVVIAAALTIVYSMPPMRTKRWGLAANLTIAVPRGLLLRLSGWSTAKDIWFAEAWYIASIFFLFLLGAASTKDFTDMEGDREGGCITLPIKYGVIKAAWMISPSFVIPFLLMPVGANLALFTGGAAGDVLSGNRLLLSVFGVGLAAWGMYVNYLILRDPEALATTENHPSWTQMYLMMMVAQVAFIVAYMVPNA